jgi:hypothetical protein
MVFTGTTKRIPSAEATSPPPHACAKVSISVFSVVYFSIDVARGEQTITNTPSEKPKTKFPLSMRLPDPADGDIHY